MGYSKYDYPTVNAVGEVSNDDGQLQIVPAPGAGLTIHLTKVTMSVHKPAVGGEGKLRLQDTTGAEIFTIDANEVRIFTLEFGDPEGYALAGRNRGIDIIVFGANDENATASVALSGYKSFQ